MSWSTPVKMKLIRPSFNVQDGSVITKRVKK
jgi:hypothetical protein